MKAVMNWLALVVVLTAWPVVFCWLRWSPVEPLMRLAVGMLIFSSTVLLQSHDSQADDSYYLSENCSGALILINWVCLVLVTMPHCL